MPTDMVDAASLAPRRPRGRGLALLDEKVLLPIGYLALLIMALGTTVDVVRRYIVGGSVEFMYPLTVDVLMPILVFLPLALMAREGGHVRVTLLADKLPPTGRVALGVLFQVVQVILWAAVGIAAAIEAYSYAIQGAPPRLTWSVHPSIGYLIVAVGAGAASVTYALRRPSRED